MINGVNKNDRSNSRHAELRRVFRSWFAIARPPFVKIFATEGAENKEKLLFSNALCPLCL